MEDKFWKEEFLPQFQLVYEKNKDKWIDNEQINIINDLHLKLKEANKNFEKYYNKFVYFLFIILLLPISLILIIPFYWTLKKFKEIKNNKDELLSKINEAEKMVINAHAELVLSLKLNDIFKEFNQIINYKNMGYLPHKLIDELKNNSIFSYQKNHSPYDSTWGILENKIVIHNAFQYHEKYLETYTATMPVRYYDIVTKKWLTDVVKATHKHVAYKIDSTHENYLFSNDCSNLEFSFAGKSSIFSSTKKFNNKNNYSPLENIKFEKNFKWIRNDESQFRMFFTPYTQEKYLENVLPLKNIPGEYKWVKINDFIKSETINHYYNIGNINYYFYKNINKFIDNVHTDCDELIKSIFDSILKYYNDIYSSFNFCWLTTILQSSNHNDIIKKIVRDDRDYKSEWLHAFVLNRYLKRKAVYSNDMETFHKFKNFKDLNLNDYKFPVISPVFEGITYDKVKKIEYVNVFSYLAKQLVIVPVEYIEYIPKTGDISFLIGFINCDIYYYKIYNETITNINDNYLIDILKETNTFIRDKIVYSLNELDENTFKKVLDIIYEYCYKNN